MTDIIQMIKITDDNFLFIKGYKDGELTFRTTKAIDRVQTEKVTVRDGMVYTNLYHFPLVFLQKFMSDNN